MGVRDFKVNYKKVGEVGRKKKRLDTRLNCEEETCSSASHPLSGQRRGAERLRATDSGAACR